MIKYLIKKKKKYIYTEFFQNGTFVTPRSDRPMVIGRYRTMVGTVVVRPYKGYCTMVGTVRSTSNGRTVIYRWSPWESTGSYIYIFFFSSLVNVKFYTIIKIYQSHIIYIENKSDQVRPTNFLMDQVVS